MHPLLHFDHFFFMNRFLSSGLAFFILFVIQLSCDDNNAEPPVHEKFALREIRIDDLPAGHLSGISVTPEIVLTFADRVAHESVAAGILMNEGNTRLDFSFANNDSMVIVKPAVALQYLKVYNLKIGSSLTAQSKATFSKDYAVSVVTEFDPSDKFSAISDEALLDSVQHRTFRYFHDFAHPASGMARERNSSGNTITSGGSGFGLMALIVGIERNFITREEGIEHFGKILDFLETADRFHGAWAHWMDGNTGKVQPFSVNDNGGDLVET